MRRDRASARSGLFFVIVAAAAVVWMIGIDPFIGRQRTKRRPIAERVQSDLRSLAVALEQYHQDKGAYPPMIPMLSLTRFTEGISPADRAVVERLRIPDKLTTPFAYVSSHFSDPHMFVKGLPYAYYTDGPGWILISVGPDGRSDIDPARDYSSKTSHPSLALLLLTYDPTNGTISAGDVWRESP